MELTTAAAVSTTSTNEEFASPAAGFKRAPLTPTPIRNYARPDSLPRFSLGERRERAGRDATELLLLTRQSSQEERETQFLDSSSLPS